MYIVRVLISVHVYYDYTCNTRNEASFLKTILEEYYDVFIVESE